MSKLIMSTSLLILLGGCANLKVQGILPIQKFEHCLELQEKEIEFCKEPIPNGAYIWISGSSEF